MSAIRKEFLAGAGTEISDKRNNTSHLCFLLRVYLVVRYRYKQEITWDITMCNDDAEIAAANVALARTFHREVMGLVTVTCFCRNEPRILG